MRVALGTKFFLLHVEELKSFKTINFPNNKTNDKPWQKHCGVFIIIILYKVLFNKKPMHGVGWRKEGYQGGEGVLFQMMNFEQNLN